MYFLFWGQLNINVYPIPRMIFLLIVFSKNKFEPLLTESENEVEGMFPLWMKCWFWNKNSKGTKDEYSLGTCIGK